MGGRNLGIVNVMGSDMARNVDHVAYTRSGPEIGVASTKNFLNQLYLLQRVWLEIRERMGLPTDELRREYSRIPDHVRNILQVYGSNGGFWEKLVPKVLVGGPLFIGSGGNYPIALEGALKLKELSYLNANGYPSGELKHGPLALIQEGTPVIGINPNGNGLVFNRTETNMEEAHTRGGYRIVVSDSTETPYDMMFQIPGVSYPLSGITCTVPLQLLALYISRRLGRNIDRPRNLAKSVTVE